MTDEPVSPGALRFNPGDPGFVADRYPALRELRDHRLGRSYLHVTTHDAMGRPPPPAWHEPFTTLNGSGLLDREPPDHTRLRRLVLAALRVRA